MKHRSYPLSLTCDYAPHWDMKKAVNEILQNAIDSPAAFEYEFGHSEDGTVSLTVTSSGITLPTRSLLLGASSKQGDASSIGKYGEGYKLALLVLTRLGYPVKVVNGSNRLWEPEFAFSAQFEAEVLHIHETLLTATGDVEPVLSFTISGLSESDATDIRNNCLHMWSLDRLGKVLEVPQGRILTDHSGSLYINGLFVCETELTYSYDIKPEFLQLDRDRQAVSSFDLLWVAKDMWLANDDADKVADMVLAEVKDVEHLRYAAEQKVSDACAKKFVERNPGVTPAKSPEDVNRLKAAGVADPRYYGATVYEVVTRSAAVQPPTVRSYTPAELLQNWYESNKKYLRRVPKEQFKDLLRQAEKWKA